MVTLKQQRRPWQGAVVAKLNYSGQEQHRDDTSGDTSPQPQLSAAAAREARLDILRLELMGSSDAETRAEIWRQLKIEMAARRAEAVA